MARLSNVTGLKGILSKLNIANKRVQSRYIAGLKVAGLFLRRESQKIVPVDKSNLKPSAFTRAIKLSFGVDVIVGYTASYAVFVHEDLEARHQEGKTAKYLEKPFREKRAQIFEIIRRISVS